MLFKPNPLLEKELEHQPIMKAWKLGVGEIVADSVRSLAPDVTGAYLSSIEAVEEGGEVYVRTRDPFGHLIEWGSVNNPPYAPIRRGVRAAGLHLHEAAKEA